MQMGKGRRRTGNGECPGRIKRKEGLVAFVGIIPHLRLRLESVMKRWAFASDPMLRQVPEGGCDKKRIGHDPRILETTMQLLIAIGWDNKTGQSENWNGADRNPMAQKADRARVVCPKRRTDALIKGIRVALTAGLPRHSGYEPRAAVSCDRGK